MFDTEVVHTDFTQPFSLPLRAALINAGSEIGATIAEEGVYVCTNGPRYETPHEIRVYRQLGGDVIGMTAATEAILMREAGVPYACLAIVTNAAAGIGSTPLSHEEVVTEMKIAGETAVQILLGAAHKIG
jgi:5'-methylthioadenosine phosphorylase